MDYILEIAVELNKLLHSLRKQRQQYVSKDRELKEAITNISHDLRTLLTAIRGYLDLFENVEKSELACLYVDVMKSRAEIMKQLTEELFRYTIISASEHKTQEIREQVKSSSQIQLPS